MIVSAIFAISFLVTFLLFPVVIPRLKRAGITGEDMNKPEKPAVAEMGGIVIVIGFITGIVTIFIIDTYFSVTLHVNLIQVLAVFSMILIMTVIGVIDDLIGVRQVTKAFLPLVASLPLVAIKAGHPTIYLPFLGPINLGIISFLVLVPIGITGAANACNILAGFNGLEIGVSTVAMGALAIIAYSIGANTSFLILLAALGALLATFRYNWYPAKVFIGDVGTFCLGGIIASAVILGDFEMAGIIIIIPHAVDFFFKLYHGFPSRGWWGIYKDGKLFCIEAGPVSLPQLVMKIFGGISEKLLVLSFIGIEAIFGATAVLIFT
jgi:UDP-N-acetylglucosamine--dolichyl-phosphate N-acetylglucosaminephosphotransferase